MSWLSGWTYRKKSSVSRASGAVTDYQMKILVGESSGATGENVDCGGHCLSNFNDLRFTKADGTTLLDYWIESISGSTPLATIWVEFDSISTTGTDFYMYYGKSDASAVSSGPNTFIYFDDFLGSSLGADWTASGTTAVGSSIVTITGQNAADSAIISTTTFPVNRAFRGRIKTDHYNDSTRREFAGQQLVTGDFPLTMNFPSHATLAAKHLVQKSSSTAANITGGITAGAFSIWSIMRKSTTDVIFRQDDANEVTITSANVPDQSLAIRLVAGTQTDAKTYADWVLIRNYQPTEPVFSGTWTTEYILALDYPELVFEAFGVTVQEISTVPLGFAQLVFEALGISTSILPSKMGVPVWTTKKPSFTCSGKSPSAAVSGKRPYGVWTAEGN